MTGFHYPLMITALALAAESSAASLKPGQIYELEIAKASQRFDLPPQWIGAVIEIESGTRPQAISTKGAMGLMQIMPATWHDLKGRYGLGDDPFKPSDNILAGSAYMRELFDAFGYPGFLRAYNAGPNRYRRYLKGVQSLPLETLDYERAVMARLGQTTPWPSQDKIPKGKAKPGPDDWRRSALFIGAAPCLGLQLILGRVVAPS